MTPGTYRFAFTNKAGVVYNASITWAGTQSATATATGNTNSSAGTVEYAFTTASGALDITGLAVYECSPDGTIGKNNISPVSNLWFDASGAPGDYTILVQQGLNWYAATITISDGPAPPPAW